MSLFIVHWAACVFIIIPKIIYIIDPKVETWIDAENLRLNDTVVQYKFSVYMATGAFLCKYITRFHKFYANIPLALYNKALLNMESRGRVKSRFSLRLVGLLRCSCYRTKKDRFLFYYNQDYIL